jgi:hypothetical protein
LLPLLLKILSRLHPVQNEKLGMMIIWPIYFSLVQHLRPWNTSSVREYCTLSRSDNSALLIDSDKVAFAITLAASTSLTSTYKMVSYLTHLSVLSIMKLLSYWNSHDT